MLARSIAILLFFASWFASLHAQMVIEPIVVQGDALPDAMRELSFLGAQEVVAINDRNEIFFMADVAASGQGLWQFRERELTSIVSPFGVATDHGTVLSHDDDTTIRSADDYQGIVLDEVLGDQPHDVWRWTPTAGLMPIALPKIPGIASASSHEVNRFGNALVMASFTELDPFVHQIDSGTWLSTPDGLVTRLTFEGQPLPETSEVYEQAFVSSLNESGGALLSNGPSNARSLWRLDPDRYDKPIPVIRPGDHLPWYGSQAEVQTVDGASLNDLGVIVGQALVRRDDGVSFETLWQSSDAGHEIVVDSSQVTPDDGRYRFSLFQSVRMNNRGEIAFSSLLESQVGSEPMQSVWKVVDGELQRIMDEGFQLPGMASTDRISFVGSPTLNEKGQLAIEIGFGESVFEKTGIWIVGTDGQLLAAAVPGVDYQDKNGQSYVFNEIGDAWDFNNNGTLVFEARTTRGSGIYRFDTVPVPESLTNAWTLAAFLISLATRRSRPCQRHLSREH